MSVFAGFLDHVERLVHDAGRSSTVDRVRHRTFLLTRFGLFLAATAGWLMALAKGHVPAAWEALAIAWLTVPLIAAAHTWRTGRLADGEAACLIAWLGLAMTTTMGGGTSVFGGCVLLLVGPLEALFAGRGSHVTATLLAATLGAVGLAVGQFTGLLHAADAPAMGDAVVALPALLFVVILARGSLSVQQQRQREVIDGEERYRVLSEAIGDLVLRFDRTGCVQMASREAEPLFGVKPRDLLGRSFFERVHVADRPIFLKLLADAAARDENGTARVRLRTGRSRLDADQPEAPVFAWIEIRVRRLDHGPEAAGPVLVGLVRDIDSQMVHEQSIERAREEAQRLSQGKDSFLANVSHELRTPLNAIIGFSELLASDAFRPADLDKQRDYARIITTSGQHLLAVVNTLLDISKIEAGRFELNPEPFDVAGMIQSCCDMIGLKAEQAGIVMTRDVQLAAGEITGDKRACKQILINLLSNAIKFTPNGGSVSVTARPEGNAILLTVADTGVGIEARDLHRLGDAFFQGQSGLDRSFEGTGLGLSVVRGLVGLHGGTITIASAPAEGTQVSIRLPLDCRTPPMPVAAARIDTIARYSRARPGRQPASEKVSKVA